MEYVSEFADEVQTDTYGNAVATYECSEDADIDVQVETDGLRTGTDADAFFTARGAIPTLTLGIPNHYMHTPAEVVDTEDMGAAASLLAAFADREAERGSFAVEL